MFAPRRSGTWEMQAVQKVTQMPGTYTTIHHSCAWGMTVHNGLPMRMLFKLVTNRPCQDTPCPHRASVRHYTDHHYLIVTSTNALADRHLDNHTAMMGHMLHLAIGADLTYLTLSPESNTLANLPTTRSTTASTAPRRQAIQASAPGYAPATPTGDKPLTRDINNPITMDHLTRCILSHDS